MAISAVWTTEGSRELAGRKRRVTGQFALDNAYVAGGFAITASTFGLNRLDDFVPSGAAISATAGTSALAPAYDKAAGKISLFESPGTAGDPLAETNIADLGGYLLRGTAIGI